MITVNQKLYGPLAFLIGNWSGDKGEDRAPGPQRDVENNKFKEEMHFEPIGLVDNHEQEMYGLRYRTMAWESGDEDPFHEELGYWLWEPAKQIALRCFVIPRGVSIIAGGIVSPTEKSFELSAQVGSETYGICSNTFLDQEFKTIKYELKVTFLNDHSFSYVETTHLKIKGQSELFLHTDQNTLVRID